MIEQMVVRHCLMACASIVSPIEIFVADEVGLRRHWSDEDKVRIVEESIRLDQAVFGVHVRSALTRGLAVSTNLRMRVGYSRLCALALGLRWRPGSSPASADFTPCAAASTGPDARGQSGTGPASAPRHPPDPRSGPSATRRGLSGRPAFGPPRRSATGPVPVPAPQADCRPIRFFMIAGRNCIGPASCWRPSR